MRLRILACALSIGLAGCNISSPQILTDRDAGRTVTIHVADQITLDLQDSWGPPGVSLTWQASSTKASVLHLDSVEDPSKHLTGLGGPGGQQIVRDYQAQFRALTAGTARIVAHGSGTCEAIAVCNRDRDVTVAVIVE
jgi:hypothetical protein